MRRKNKHIYAIQHSDKHVNRLKISQDHIDSCFTVYRASIDTILILRMQNLVSCQNSLSFLTFVINFWAFH